MDVSDPVALHLAAVTDQLNTLRNADPYRDEPLEPYLALVRTSRRHLIRLGELAADHDLTDLQNTLLPQFEAELNAASDWAVRGGIDAPPFQQRKDSKGSPLRNICRSAAI